MQPHTIRLETPHYVVRTIEPGDATDEWQQWLLDPVAARMLNVQPERLSQEALQAYIARFDRSTAHLLGIFEKDAGHLVGIRAVYVDPSLGEFLVNVLVGETGARNKGARGESRTVMYRYFFEDMGLHTARCTVLSHNAPILKVMRDNGWIFDRTERRSAAAGDSTVEILHFHLPREVWRAKEADV